VEEEEEVAVFEAVEAKMEAEMVMTAMLIATRRLRGRRTSSSPEAEAERSGRDG
jgi:hypothetical protein